MTDAALADTGAAPRGLQAGKASPTSSNKDAPVRHKHLVGYVRSVKFICFIASLARKHQQNLDLCGS